MPCAPGCSRATSFDAIAMRARRTRRARPARADWCDERESEARRAAGDGDADDWRKDWLDICKESPLLSRSLLPPIDFVKHIALEMSHGCCPRPLAGKRRQTRRRIVKLLKTEGAMDSASLAGAAGRDGDGGAAASLCAAAGEARQRAEERPRSAWPAGEVLAADEGGRAPLSGRVCRAERRAHHVGAGRVRPAGDGAPARRACGPATRRLPRAD